MADRSLPKDKQFASTLARGIAVLQAFDGEAHALGNGELAARLTLDRSTVSRLTYTLLRLGYLEHAITPRKYRLAPGVLRLGYSLLAGMQMRHLARPFMRELARATTGVVGIGIRYQTRMVYLEAIASHDGPYPVIDRGMPIPLLASAMGNAWLATATPTEREQALNLHRTRDPALHARYGQRPAAAIRELRDLGYCTSTGHRRRDRFSVAAPMGRRVDGQIVVFNCTLQSDGLAPRERMKQELGPQLLEMLAKVEAAAGIGTG